MEQVVWVSIIYYGRFVLIYKCLDCKHGSGLHSACKLRCYCTLQSHMHDTAFYILLFQDLNVSKAVHKYDSCLSSKFSSFHCKQNSHFLTPKWFGEHLEIFVVTIV